MLNVIVTAGRTATLIILLEMKESGTLLTPDIWVSELLMTRAQRLSQLGKVIGDSSPINLCNFPTDALS